MTAYSFLEPINKNVFIEVHRVQNKNEQRLELIAELCAVQMRLNWYDEMSPPPADEGYTPETFVFFISHGYQALFKPGSLFEIRLDWIKTLRCNMFKKYCFVVNTNRLRFESLRFIV
jgi:hypothetical protein